MNVRRQRRRPLSLRTRLIAGVLLLVTLAIGAVATSTYVALQSFLVNRMDRQLASAPPHLADPVCGGSVGQPHDRSRGGPWGAQHDDDPHWPMPLLVSRLDADGRPDPACSASGYPYPLRLSAPDAARLAQQPGRPVELREPEGPVLAMARPTPDGVDVFALPMDDVQATLDRLLMLELLVGAVALVFAGTAGAIGVGRGLRPLTQVTDTAFAVAGELGTGELGARELGARELGSGGRGPGGQGVLGRGSGGGLGRRVPEGAPGTEVGRLAQAFNTMLNAVQTEVAGRQASEQRMRQFLADASHELRTPLTSLRGYAELITMRERRDGVQREPESADALRRITEEGARMSRLVNDLLTLARCEDGTSDRADNDGREDDSTTNDAKGNDSGGDRGRGQSGGGSAHDTRVALDELAVDAVADLRAAHPARSISLSARPSSVVRGDPDQLRQILANLLTNAAVHTAGDIRVQVERVDGQVHAAVADDGPGLTAPQAAHAFDRFWRADKARTRVKGGSGLGLSIVDTLVGAHGGGIDFDTSPSAGTTVTVRIPAAP